eukprot:CAMPEP_0174360860 /NCGR_PEP_ID=MMETSP0811_2-20130205/56430_1 /TAXON_ID=73025 ORGANISM="Eutreptiella gymnastica-like, Strain CCMP1594" /NCGR_SAMPLE_ID=MMETSP0811_2 /ASSEMBLY_ACC=CAM_ASM_000667 /LENGTH=46 /DNA_ID= /DNA_START= /DNA_END= /DNA_ORIENTATION=
MTVVTFLLRPVRKSEVWDCVCDEKCGGPVQSLYKNGQEAPSHTRSP